MSDNNYRSSSITKSELNTKKVEQLEEAFRLGQKDPDSALTKEDGYYFLDDNSTNNYFDRKCADKIFKVIFDEKDQEISVKDFISSFLALIENLKGSIKEFEKSYNKEKEKIDDYESKYLFYKNENLSNEVADNATLQLELTNVEFAETSGWENKNFIVSILINSNKDELLSTSPFNIYSTDLQEQFEL